MFKYVDRKEKESLVVISGWAFDERIFERLDLPYNYYLYRGRHDNFEKTMDGLLRAEGLEKVSLLGWSKGAFIAANYACKRQEKIERLIMVGARKHYNIVSLETIKEYLRKNRTAFLYKLYKDCFSKEQKEEYLWFKQNLQGQYLEQMDGEQLIEGLQELAGVQFDFEGLRAMKNLQIVHGTDDAIAPMSEIVEFAKELPGAELITLDNCGHMPFLHRDFGARLS
jgi:pimeloyl-ACP methyl ester carboxylesterase